MAIEVSLWAVLLDDVGVMLVIVRRTFCFGNQGNELVWISADHAVLSSQHTLCRSDGFTHKSSPFAAELSGG
jgi:hypothetical protein